MKRVMFYIRLFPYFVSQNIKSKMSYSMDFFLGIIANILRQMLGFVFIWMVFKNVPEIKGWSFNQIMFVYGMQAVTLGLNEFLFPGTWSIGAYVREGELDRLLLRPVSTLFSIMASNVTFHGLGAASFGLVICITSLIKLKIVLSVYLLFFWIVAIICGTLIYFSINMCCATLSFWITDTDSAMILLQNVSEFSKYPTIIYKRFLQIILTFVFPFAFTSYFPSAVILNMSNCAFYFLGTVLATAACLSVTAIFWRYGLSKYQSAGG